MVTANRWIKGGQRDEQVRGGARSGQRLVGLSPARQAMEGADRCHIIGIRDYHEQACAVHVYRVDTWVGDS